MAEDNQFQEIPERFYSFSTKRPFDSCIECESYLLDGREYLIEKAIKRYKGYSAEDTVFDYAICTDCAMRMRKEFSKESIANIDSYFTQGMMMSNLMSSSGMEDLNVDACLERCIIKDHHISEIEEFQIYAYCKGRKLFKGVPPYMVSGDAIEEILPLISSSTTDFLNGFYDKHFSPDPSFLEPNPTKLVFI